jgi:uncharacterized short protein YbdD (DUF466 family)
MNATKKWWQRAWEVLRQLTGDDAYDRYLVHHRTEHNAEHPPLTRSEFYRQRLERKWRGVNRCC